MNISAITAIDPMTMPATSPLDMPELLEFELAFGMVDVDVELETLAVEEGRDEVLTAVASDAVVVAATPGP